MAGHVRPEVVTYVAGTLRQNRLDLLRRSMVDLYWLCIIHLCSHGTIHL
jgi:hypothetical protein